MFMSMSDREHATACKRQFSLGDFSHRCAWCCFLVVEVEGEVVPSPAFVAAQERPACGSSAVVLDPATVMLHWDADPDTAV